MEEKLRKAILNNNDLYEAVFKPQDIKFNRSDSIWYSFEKTPPLYSNLVTVSAGWKPDKIFQSIDENFTNKNWEEWSIKDSFAELDLSPYGFKKLFDANWIYVESAKFTPIKTKTKLEFKVIKTQNDLAGRRIAWDANEQLGKQIFHLDLLDSPKIYFVVGCREENLECGCLLNETEDVLGISNFFAPDSKTEYWSEAISFVLDSIKFTDIVGYERKSFTEELKRLNFEAIGDLAVWLRKADIS